jgi:hypothetical protein
MVELKLRPPKDKNNQPEGWPLQKQTQDRGVKPPQQKARARRTPDRHDVSRRYTRFYLELKTYDWQLVDQAAEGG